MKLYEGVSLLRQYASFGGERVAYEHKEFQFRGVALKTTLQPARVETLKGFDISSVQTFPTVTVWKGSLPR